MVYSARPAGTSNLKAREANRYIPEINYKIKMTEYNQFIFIIILLLFLMENTDNNQSQSVAIQFTASSKLGLKQLKLLRKSNSPQSYIPFLFRNKK